MKGVVLAPFDQSQLLELEQSCYFDKVQPILIQSAFFLGKKGRLYKLTDLSVSQLCL